MKIIIIDEASNKSAAEKYITGNSTTLDDKIDSFLKKSIDNPFGQLEYVTYTSSAYDVFLKKAPSKSIFPVNSIYFLSRGKTYVGTDHIFCSDSSNTIQIIDSSIDTDSEIMNLYADKNRNPPEGMLNAISWALCASAISNLRKSGEPCTMMIPLDTRSIHVNAVTHAVLTALKSPDLIERCERVYQEQTNRLKLRTYQKLFPDLTGVIQDYPHFDEIKSIIIESLAEGITSIYTDDCGSKTKGVVLCYDIERERFENYISGSELSLISEYNCRSTHSGGAPLYILIAFRNISRGLSIKKLVSTYITKTIDKKDVNLPLGTWCGKHTGYELLPRAWMSPKSFTYYCNLSKLEQDLRIYLKNHYVYSPDNLPPSFFEELDRLHQFVSNYGVCTSSLTCSICGKTIFEGEVYYDVPTAVGTYRCYNCQNPITNYYQDIRRKTKENIQNVIAKFLLLENITIGELEKTTGTTMIRITKELQKNGYLVIPDNSNKKSYGSSRDKDTVYKLDCCSEHFKFLDDLKKIRNTDNFYPLYKKYLEKWKWILYRLFSDYGELYSNNFDDLLKEIEYTSIWQYNFFERSCKRLCSKGLDNLLSDKYFYHYANKMNWVKEQMEHKNRDIILQKVFMEIFEELPKIDCSSLSTIMYEGIQFIYKITTNNESSSFKKEDSLNLIIHITGNSVECLSFNQHKPFEEFFNCVSLEIHKKLDFICALVDRGF